MESLSREELSEIFNINEIDKEALKKAKAHNTFASVCSMGENYDKAITHYEKALDLIEPYKIFTNIYQNLGKCYTFKKDFDNAIQFY